MTWRDTLWMLVGIGIGPFCWDIAQAVTKAVGNVIREFRQHH